MKEAPCRLCIRFIENDGRCTGELPEFKGACKIWRGGAITDADRKKYFTREK